jgi:paraquat-inducible protein B
MPRRFEPKLVGAFVIASVALGVAVAVALGAGRLFQQRVRFVVVFSEDLSGLEVDAPVKFRGVPVGRVASIHLAVASATEPLRDLHMPVVIEVNETRIRNMGGTIDFSDPHTIRTLVDHGLRAHLGLESLLANRRYVALDVAPDAPPPHPSTGSLPYPEIPVYEEPGLATLQAEASKLISKFQRLDLEGLVDDLRHGAKSFERAASSLGEAASHVPETLRIADGALASLGGAARAIEAGATPVATDARATMAKLRGTLEAVDGTAQRMNALVDPASPLVEQLSATLAEIQSTSRSVRYLAQGIDKDPGELVRGRAESRR